MTLLLLLLAPMADPTGNWATPPTPGETQAASALRDASTSDEVRAAATAAIESLGTDNPSISTLRDAAASGSVEDAQLAAESLTYRPKDEAPLAEDYPPPTRLHAVEIKQLPAYRMARVQMPPAEKAATGSIVDGGGKDAAAFWSLFQHIQREQIAMTAPVRIEYEGASPQSGRSSMAFLYRRPAMGTAGADDRDEKVNVVDVPARRVVSTSVKTDDEQSLMRAAERLRAYLDKQTDYIADGPVEVLGYNGPMTPRAQRITEVQIPVKPAGTPSN